MSFITFSNKKSFQLCLLSSFACFLSGFALLLTSSVCFFFKLLSCVCCARDIYKYLVLSAKHFVPIGRNKSFWCGEHFVSTARNKMYLSLKRTVSLIETNRILYWNKVFSVLKHSSVCSKMCWQNIASWSGILCKKELDNLKKLPIHAFRSFFWV